MCCSEQHVANFKVALGSDRDLQRIIGCSLAGVYKLCEGTQALLGNMNTNTAIS